MDVAESTPADSLPEITPALLKKYDRPGPRYTSYPTAPKWHDGVGPDFYRQALAAAATQPERPLSLYVHIPFCKSRCAYCGCNVVADATADMDAYLDCLEKEIQAVASLLPERRTVAQCHWGGGTPTFMNVRQMTRLFEALTTSFSVLPTAEIAIETNPASATAEQLQCLRGLGFNRISFGVQDLDPGVQQAVGRCQTQAQTQEALSLCRELGFQGINMDLIYGLPLQTESGWRRTIDAIIAMRPDRLAVYSYAHLPQRFAHQKNVDALQRPDVAEKYALFAAARKQLMDAGYHAIGMDHFALPDDELAVALGKGVLHRNFMGYTVQHAPDQLGFGASAIGELDDYYVQNERDPAAYGFAITQYGYATTRGMHLSRDDIMRRWVIRRLMCTFFVDKALFQELFDLPFDTCFKDEQRLLEYYAQEGLLTIDEQGLCIMPLGSAFVRNICMAFDVYMQRDDTTMFSRTI